MEKLSKGELEPEAAKQIVSVSGRVIEIAKIQLAAVEMTTGNVSTAPLLGLNQVESVSQQPSLPAPVVNSDSEKAEKEYMINKVKKAKGSDVYELKTLYAKKLGFKNISEAIGEYGASEFERKYLKQED